MSLIEAITNVVVGYVIALLTQILVFPLFALEVSLGENLAIGGLFTLASIARSYTLRRAFEAIRKQVPPGKEPGGIGHSETGGGLPLGFSSSRHSAMR